MTVMRKLSHNARACDLSSDWYDTHTLH